MIVDDSIAVNDILARLNGEFPIDDALIEGNHPIPSILSCF